MCRFGNTIIGVLISWLALLLPTPLAADEWLQSTVTHVRAKPAASSKLDPKTDDLVKTSNPNVMFRISKLMTFSESVRLQPPCNRILCPHAESISG